MNKEKYLSRFTLILSSNYAASSSTPVPAKITSAKRKSRGSDDSNKDDLFPASCFVCGKIRKQRNKKDCPIIVVSTRDAETTIKEAAKDKNLDFYYENKEVDLIAKELRYHRDCYKSFTRGYSSDCRDTSQQETFSTTTSNETRQDEHQLQGDYISVQEYITENVIKRKQTVSMGVLHSVYDLHVDDSRYRAKLKRRIQNDFKDAVSFFSVGKNLPDMVINTALPVEEIAFHDKQGCVIKAAEYLRNDILTYCETLPELSWPPTIEELSSEEREPPSSLLLFERHLLNVNSSKKKPSDLVVRKMNSMISDMINAVSQGKTVTLKHYLLALGLHNMTGQRKVIDILNRLGHCLDYPSTCQIESAEAIKSQKLANNHSSLPLLPIDNSQYVLTVFWVDNFDMKVESQSGHNSINTTHLVAFQEKTQNAVFQPSSVSVEKTGQRTIPAPNKSIAKIEMNPKKEPPMLPQAGSSSTVYQLSEQMESYFLWISLRKLNDFDQLIPSFSGWRLKQRSKKDIKKTVQTYLPPFNSKVTEPETIFAYMEYLQVLAEKVNMPYVNITLDVGAALNAFKMVWNHTQRFRNVVIHLGDFHFLKENFQVYLNMFRRTMILVITSHDV